jgi:hypothetical protein
VFLSYAQGPGLHGGVEAFPSFIHCSHALTALMAVAPKPLTPINEGLASGYVTRRFARLVLIDLGLHRLSRIAVHDACAFGLRCATQGVLPFAFDRHVQSSEVQAAMPIFCSSVRREAAQTCGPSEPLAWGWGKGVCPLGTRRHSVCPRVRNSSFHRAAILLSCGVGYATRPTAASIGSRF